MYLIVRYFEGESNILIKEVETIVQAEQWCREHKGIDWFDGYVKSY